MQSRENPTNLVTEKGLLILDVLLESGNANANRIIRITAVPPSKQSFHILFYRQNMIWRFVT